MTADGEDPSTWPRYRQVIDRDELLRLIAEVEGLTVHLDLRGANFTSDDRQNPIDLSPEALAPLTAAYQEGSEGADCPWLSAKGGVNLRLARLERSYLLGARLQRADLFGTNLQGAYLIGAQLQSTDLGGAELQGADLMDAQLQGAALSGAMLHDTHFFHAHLQRADLTFARLQGVDMDYVASLDGARWHGVYLDRTRMRRKSLGEAIGDELEAHDKLTAEAYECAKESYLALKNNFNQIGRYEDASWAYVKEQQMEKMAHHWEWRSQGWKVWRGWGSLWRWLRNWAYELLTGYGERVYMPVLWAVVTVAAFAIVYGMTGNVSPDFAGDPALAHGSHNPVHALTHSVGALATIGFNTLEPLGWGARLLTAVEAALGISLFALFIFTLGNRMSRG